MKASGLTVGRLSLANNYCSVGLNFAFFLDILKQGQFSLCTAKAYLMFLKLSSDFLKV